MKLISEKNGRYIWFFNAFINGHTLWGPLIQTGVFISGGNTLPNSNFSFHCSVPVFRHEEGVIWSSTDDTNLHRLWSKINLAKPNYGEIWFTNTCNAKYSLGDSILFTQPIFCDKHKCYATEVCIFKIRAFHHQNDTPMGMLLGIRTNIRNIYIYNHKSN